MNNEVVTIEPTYNDKKSIRFALVFEMMLLSVRIDIFFSHRQRAQIYLKRCNITISTILNLRLRGKNLFR